MAADYCFQFPNELDSWSAAVTFKSPDGEEYTVKPYKDPRNPSRNWTAFSKLNIEWKTLSSKLIIFQIYYDGQASFANSEYQLVKNARSAIVNKNGNNLKCLTIHLIIIPHILPNVIAKKDEVPIVLLKQEPVMNKKLDKLSMDMKSILESGHMSDIVITDGINEINAHKLIVSMRSTVFAKMLEHPLKEKLENRITIEDVSFPILKELLGFMYSGAVVIKDAKMAQNLYIAANKYAVLELKNICSEELKKVALDDVLDTLLLADLHDDRKLKKAALDFVSQNYSKVKALQAWNGFLKDNQVLAIEILSFVIDKKI